MLLMLKRRSDRSEVNDDEVFIPSRRRWLHDATAVGCEDHGGNWFLKRPDASKMDVETLRDDPALMRWRDSGERQPAAPQIDVSLHGQPSEAIIGLSQTAGVERERERG